MQVKQFEKFGALAAAMLAVAALSACSFLEGDKVDYKSASKGQSLEVPPDLTQLSRDSRYIVPGSGPVTASSYAAGQTVAGLPTAATAIGDVRIERSGSQRWLVVNRPPDQLWGPVRDFWQESGFLIVTDQPTLGIMETDWAENRAKIPQDLIRNTLGKLIDSVYSTAERDKFRTRFERSPNGGTEIYISHRGMIEVYDSAQKDRTVWQPRPTDPELEAEFLGRLMVRLGVPQAQSKALVAGGAEPSTSRVVTVNNLPAVEIDEGFDRAWRRVGLALDRTGFTVEDRDRSAGTYFVRYVPPSPDRKEQGFIARLFHFGSDKSESPLKYRIALKSVGQKTTVSVLNEKGAPETSPTAQRIVQVIADDLK
ncbi:MAG TPA: outer membrane protein assembly factor BamC [Ramlibacter sp.]|uniref:outer membrane protein assembly factor BamC n=1 Tax=Ramlibacter sp. TaxID=1917967 RepID=UPI002CB880D4|nr:outer membrane protein assembly factor BamC [Ramlibacter sp.]HVZ46311.1 outer membrane protein assembly factor BamC [Ramlibacter sp.]